MSNLWEELHIRALTVKDNDHAYLLQFGQRIPRYTRGCKCKEFWNSYIKLFPPKFGKEYFAWTVHAHNAVNKKLGKPYMTIENARIIYENNKITTKDNE